MGLARKVDARDNLLITEGISNNNDLRIARITPVVSIQFVASGPVAYRSYFRFRCPSGDCAGLLLFRNLLGRVKSVIELAFPSTVTMEPRELRCGAHGACEAHTISRKIYLIHHPDSACPVCNSL